MRDIKVVIGSNYGDEGKGYMTDYFSSLNENEKTIVVCSNGGSQKGHTVETNDNKRHIFHHFGSGMFVNADTFLPKAYILNPIIFVQEYNDIKQKTNITNTFIDNDCRFSTPFDMMLNQILEISRNNNRHGSCGFGIWETVVRYREDENAITIKQASKLSKQELYDYVLKCKEYSLNRLKNIYKINLEDYDDWKDLWYNSNLVMNYIDDFNFMIQKTQFVSKNKILNDYKNIVFENSQGLLLDQSKKEYINNTTPSNTGLKAVIEILNNWENNEEKEIEVCYVTRSYITKHGAGNLPNECKKEDINVDMFDKTNRPNPYQGTLRYAKLDYKQLLKQINDDFEESKKISNIKFYKSLAITHLNEYPFDEDKIIDKFDNVYLSNGKTRDYVIKKK
jgi:adenylosuccinate synthase